MMQIPCPWCGPRNEAEFRYGGEAHLVRPDPETASDLDWGAYLHHRTNRKGLHRERWMHGAGCRRWFNLARDTVSNEILGAYRIGEPGPRGEDDP
jgi:heterotetrameric sarcosine oxidase delta subunit